MLPHMRRYGPLVHRFYSNIDGPVSEIPSRLSPGIGIQCYEYYYCLLHFREYCIMAQARLRAIYPRSIQLKFFLQEYKHTCIRIENVDTKQQ